MFDKLRHLYMNFKVIQHNETQRKDKENMPCKEFDKILFDLIIPLVGNKCSGEILESTFVYRY